MSPIPDESDTMFKQGPSPSSKRGGNASHKVYVKPVADCTCPPARATSNLGTEDKEHR